ncbi:MAG TPA: hypothetical protein VFY48_02870 [Solirubrobacterales bacterium]|nr:hypothetical protein [Solirubrobacterales bacterium]
MRKSNRLNREGQRRAIGIAVSAVLVLVAVVLAVSGGDGGDEVEVEAVDTTPRLVEPADLGELEETLGHAVYWAGERPPEQLELAQDASGNVFLRYLPPGVEAGDPGAEFLTVGTYPFADPVAGLESTAAEVGANLQVGPDGAKVLVNPEAPDSAYLAYPGSELQVEVYDPSGAALELVRSGQIGPAG